MKIRISDKEVYEVKIDVNEEMSPDQFLGMMERFRFIEKFLARDLMRDVMKEDTDNNTKKIRSNAKYKFDTKEKAVDFLNEIQSFGENKKERLNIMGPKYFLKDNKYIMDKARYLKKVYNITEKEIKNNKVYNETEDRKSRSQGKVTMVDFDTKEKASKLYHEYNQISELDKKEKFSKDKGFVSHNALKVTLTKLKQQYNLKNGNSH